MNLVDRLKASHSFIGDPLHREAWEEIERLREEASKKDKWQPWSTVPENTDVLIAFYWKEGKEWYEEGATWDTGIGHTDDRNGRYVDIIHLDLEDFDAVWLPLPAPYKREKE